jgi:hypothetical protein
MTASCARYKPFINAKSVPYFQFTRPSVVVRNTKSRGPKYGVPGILAEVAPLLRSYDRVPRMSALKLVLWGFLAVLGSVVLAFVVGLVNPQGKVNALWLVVGASCLFRPARITA